MFFTLSTAALTALLILVVGGATVLGTFVGRRMRARGVSNHEPVAVVQATLLGFLGLLLAFGLTMAVGRYEARRALVVQEANDLGTTYLRAQLLQEPMRATSLDLLKQYSDVTIDLANQIPDVRGFRVDLGTMSDLQRELWSVAGDAVAADPQGTAPRLYVDTLNDTFDTHDDRLASLRNRVPSTVMALQVFGSAIALFVLAMYLALLGRGVFTSLAAAAVVILILFISFDLDRPQRGLITVPYAPLVSVRAGMEGPPAYSP